MYRIILERKAEKEADHIPVKYRKAIDEEILSFVSNPRPQGSKKLTDKDGYRVRVGDYRILYTIDEVAKVVVIYRIKIKGKSTYR